MPYRHLIKIHSSIRVPAKQGSAAKINGHREKQALLSSRFPASADGGLLSVSLSAPTQRFSRYGRHGQLLNLSGVGIKTEWRRGDNKMRRHTINWVISCGLLLVAAIALGSPAVVLGCSSVPSLISPENGSSYVDQRPAFTWDNGANPDAGNFLLSVCEYPDANTNCWSISGNVNSGIVERRFLDDLKPDTQYYWQVKYICGNSWGPASEIMTFHTTSAPTGELVLQYPNGGEIQHAGKVLPIIWTTAGTVPYVKIEIYRKGTLFSSIVSDLPNSLSDNGFYLWTIPADFPRGAKYYIKITTPDNFISDTSNGAFQILGSARIK